jgi:hypothetical protein
VFKIEIPVVITQKTVFYLKERDPCVPLKKLLLGVVSVSSWKKVASWVCV